LFWPLVVTAWTALSPAAPSAPLLGDTTIGERAVASLLQAALSTMAAVAVGVPIAYVSAHVRFPGRSLLRFAVGLPLVTPTIVVAIAFEALVGPEGWANEILATYRLAPIAITGTLWGIVAAHLFVATAIIARPLTDVWSHLDRPQEEAAEMLGASRLRVFEDVTWPLLRPALASASVLAFVFAFTSFAIVLVLGSAAWETMEVTIFRLVVLPIAPTQAALLSLVQFATALVVLAPAPLRPVSGVGRRMAQGRTFWRASWPARFLTLIVVLAVAAFIVAPVAAMIRTAVTVDGIVSDANFRMLFDASDPTRSERTISAIVSSTSLAVGAAALAVLLGVTTAMAVAPAYGRAARLLQGAMLLPLAVPPNALALGYLLTFQAGGSILGVPSLVLLVHAVIATPVALRAVLPAARRLDVRLVEAAGLLGAPPARGWWIVSMPHMRRPIAIGALLAACVSLGQLGATLLLRRVDFSTLPIEIYETIADPVSREMGRAAALSTITAGIAMVAFACIEWLRPREGGEL
jgi:thiamine transport system permease protein